jgi:hypothetical protein
MLFEFASQGKGKTNQAPKLWARGIITDLTQEEEMNLDAEGL